MPTRINVKQARNDLRVSDAILICAYDSAKKFEDNRLEDAISLDELRSQEDSLAKDRELIFY